MNRLAASVCLLAFAGLVYSISTSENSPVAASPQAATSPACSCGDGCDCCDACPCDEPKSVQHDAQKSVDPQTGLTAEKPTVYMLSTDGCSWCVRWMNTESQKYVAAGWTVQEVKGYQADLYPTFRLYHRGKWFGHRGFMSTTAAKRLLGR